MKKTIVFRISRGWWVALVDKSIYVPPLMDLFPRPVVAGYVQHKCTSHADALAVAVRYANMRRQQLMIERKSTDDR